MLKDLFILSNATFKVKEVQVYFMNILKSQSKTSRERLKQMI